MPFSAFLPFMAVDMFVSFLRSDKFDKFHGQQSILISDNCHCVTIPYFFGLWIIVCDAWSSNLQILFIVGHSLSHVMNLIMLFQWSEFILCITAMIMINPISIKRYAKENIKLQCLNLNSHENNIFYLISNSLIFSSRFGASSISLFVYRLLFFFIFPRSFSVMEASLPIVCHSAKFNKLRKKLIIQFLI